MTFINVCVLFIFKNEKFDKLEFDKNIFIIFVEIVGNVRRPSIMVDN